jgi:hypothetical protein
LDELIIKIQNIHTNQLCLIAANKSKEIDSTISNNIKVDVSLFGINQVAANYN